MRIGKMMVNIYDGGLIRERGNQMRYSRVRKISGIQYDYSIKLHAIKERVIGYKIFNVWQEPHQWVNRRGAKRGMRYLNSSQILHKRARRRERIAIRVF